MRVQCFAYIFIYAKHIFNILTSLLILNIKIVVCVLIEKVNHLMYHKKKIYKIIILIIIVVLLKSSFNTRNVLRNVLYISHVFRLRIKNI